MSKVSSANLLAVKRLDTNCASCRSLSGERSTTPCGQAIGKPVVLGEYIGIFDIFKIGIGPSSSHTMGPMSAGKKFVSMLRDQNMLMRVERLEISLYGSLAMTGKGHATDKATVLGLAGYEPATIDPDEADHKFAKILRDRVLVIDGQRPCPFDFDADLTFHYEVELPYHPNGMTIAAYEAPEPQSGAGDLILSETYYSIGGGFIKTEKELLKSLHTDDKDESGLSDSVSTSCDSPVQASMASESRSHPADCILTQSNPHGVAAEISLEKAIFSDSAFSTSTMAEAIDVPYPFTTCEELLATCVRTHLAIAEVMFENECVAKKMTKGEIYARLDEIAAVIDGCVERGMRVEGKMPVSNIPRRAAQIKRRLRENMEKALFDPLSVSDWIALYARAVNEENACGGRVVTAPTNGAAGTLPAVLTYYRRSIPTCSKQGIRDFLAVAAAIGSLCKRNASISGAEAGCQAEVGSACAMAAAGLCCVLGGSNDQIENAAEIGLEHCLGLTCDPIMGLVQIPCIERNCVAAIKAVMSCRLAMCGDGDHEVSLDSCIETMYRTGLDMQAKYKETSTGGLALYGKKKVVEY